MNRRVLLGANLLVAGALVACSPAGAGPAASGAPSSSPSVAAPASSGAAPAPGASAQPSSAGGATKESPKPSASATTTKPTDLAALAKQHGVILKQNAVATAAMPVKVDSPCTTAAGLKPERVKKAKRVLFLPCDRLAEDALAPARILPDETTPAQAVQTYLAGPTVQELDAGFRAGVMPPQAKTPVETAVVSDVLIVDVLGPQDAEFSARREGVRPLEATAAKAAGVGKVSVLVQHAPTCWIAKSC